mgnify:FL=1|tara:strand:- start:1327 stop:1806 length:480 start_codon:yes stop_codon:yes gene_type:complete
MSILQNKSQDVVKNSSTSNEAFVETREYTGNTFYYGQSKTNPNSLSVIVVDRVISPMEFNTTAIPGLSIATGGGKSGGIFALWTPLTNIDDDGKSLGVDEDGKPIRKAVFRFPKQKSIFLKHMERGTDVGKMFNITIDMNDPLLDDDGQAGGMYWAVQK